MRAYLGLGSNIGDGIAHIQRAFELLEAGGCNVRRVSSFYKTEPVGLRDQPWFINCVAEVETGLSPRALLRAAKSFESAMGRQRTFPGGPRLIDIDILLYEDAEVNLPTVTIPHPRLGERRFMLVPLKELAPTARHPISKKTVSQMLRETADRSRVNRIRQR